MEKKKNNKTRVQNMPLNRIAYEQVLDRFPEKVGERYIVITSKGVQIGCCMWKDKKKGIKQFYAIDKSDWNHYPIENVLCWLREIPLSSITHMENEVVLPTDEDDEKLIDGLMGVVDNAGKYGIRTSLAQVRIFKLILQYKCKIKTIQSEKPIVQKSDSVEFIEWAHHWAVRLGKNKWLYNKQTHIDGISTEELYQIYLKLQN